MTDTVSPESLLSDTVTLAAVCEDGNIFTSDRRGIAPLLSVLDATPDLLKNARCADRIVGKAAAMLFVLCGVNSVHALTASIAGKDMLTRHGISFTCDELTDYVINRTGDGMCPMESAVICEDDPVAGEHLLRQKIKKMQSNETAP